MELEFKNKNFTIKVVFYDNMIALKERFILDKMPKDTEKHPCKTRKLKSGRISCYQEFYIPNGFIFDALCINDEKIKEEIFNWLRMLIADIAKQRGIDISDKAALQQNPVTV